MRPRICICCGEPMAEAGNALSRNPNVCASCSSIADGMDDATVPKCTEISTDPACAAEESNPSESNPADVPTEFSHPD